MKNIFLKLLVFLILAVSAVGIYVALHYEQPEEFIQKLMGEEKTAEKTEDIEFRTVQMSFPYRQLEIMPESCGSAPEDYEARGTVFCYFKEQNVSLWLPCESFVPETDRVYILSEKGSFEEIDSAYCILDGTRRQIGITGEYMAALADGDYYFVRTGTDMAGQESSLRYAVHVETAPSFGIPQSGIATKGDYRYEQYFDLQNPEDIVVHLYNIGKNGVAGISNEDNLGYKLKEGEYRLADEGNTIIISKDYLSGLPALTLNRLSIKQINGSKMEDKINIVVTKGGIERPEFDVPAVYSRGSGEDFVIPCKIDESKVTVKSVVLVYFDEEGIEQENLDITEYLKDGGLVVPAEEVLQYDRTDAGISVEYRIGDYFTGNWYDFRIVP